MIVKNMIRLVLCILLFACACTGHAQAKVINTNIVFYGKVVDQYYAPVTNAEVAIDIDYLDQSNAKITKRLNVSTDNKGFFILNNYGSAMHINGIVKEGYEFDYRKNMDHYFEYSSAFQKASFVSDQNAPVIFHMAKLKDEPAYLIHLPPQERNFLPTERSTYNLNLGGNWINSNGQFIDSNGHVDLAVRCTLSQDKDKMELTIISMDSNSGLIASDEYLEIAPAQGYEPQTVIEIDIPERYQQLKKYVYAKSRGGMMYSRLDLNFAIRPSNLLMSIEIWTNPQHSRNLKYDKAFQKYAKRLRYEVRERHYQQNLRAMKNKKRFKYMPRTLPVTGAMVINSDAAKIGKNAKNNGPSYRGP
jgi:hypothetical protein